LCLALVTVALLVGGCRSNTSTVPTSTRIGVLDPQRVLGETNAGKRAKDMLASFAKNRQALIELEEKELRRMEEDFVKQGSVLSARQARTGGTIPSAHVGVPAEGDRFESGSAGQTERSAGRVPG
jgi:outer membrane protein